MIPPDRPFRRSARSRADLLYLLAQHASARHAELADLVGFEPAQRELPAKKQRPFPETDGQAGATEPTPPSIGSTKKPKARFFLVKERESIAPKDRQLERPLDADTGRSLAEREQTGITLGSPPIPADLAPWKRLWPFLRLVLGQAQYGRTLDLRRLIKCISQGEVLRVLPKIPRRSWSTSCQLILDRDLRLLPFWQDFIALADRLSSFRGTAGMEILVFEQGPNGPCRQYEPGKRFPLQHYRRPVAGTPILVLGDLGLLPGGQKKAWMSFGRQLRSAGLEPVALVPCPERYWSRRTARLFSMYVWDIERRLPAKPMQRMRKKGGSGEEAEAQVDQLLDLLAPATHLEPALIRAVRCLLSSEPMDVGCEIAAWLHQDVYPTPLGALWKPEAMKRRRENFRALPNRKKEAVRKMIQAVHSYLPESEQATEELILAELEGKPELDEQAQRFFWDLFATVDESGGFARLAQLESWIRRKQGDMHSSIWGSSLADPLTAVVARMAGKRVEAGQDFELPEGFDYKRVLWALQGAGQEKRYRLMQRLEPLELEPDTGKAQGSPLGVLHLDSMQFQWQHEDEQGRRGELHLRNTEHLDSIPVPKSGLLHIQGSQERLTVEGITRPEWAKSIRRDPKGLGLCLSSGNDSADLYWLPPQEYPLRDKKGGSLGSFTVTKGCWIRADEFEEIRQQGFIQPQWAKRMGTDQYGLYADLVFRGVTQRFRWIQPGSFMMGSPESEPERDDDETQRNVILTESYWLSDTACTQEFWQAVTGKNPSRFIGKQRPVEQVSWNDVQELTKQINKAIPSLELDLPSEAQWEYACRAGTNTPFSFGNTVSIDQVNFDGNYPYPGGKNGLYRKETVEAQALPCNQWGLYQMHGNVWEWCRDRYREFTGEGVTVDLDSTTEGRNRVCRGGSWDDRATYCRSAYRNGDRSVFKNYWLGFRLYQGRNSTSDVEIISEVDLSGTKIPFSEFDIVIQQHINELCNSDEFKFVKEKIYFLSKNQSKKTIGELLCSPDIEIEFAIGWLNQAAAEVVQAMPKGKENQQREAFKKTAKKILGWLVLRTVDPEWVRKQRSNFLKEQGAQLSIRATNLSCVEVIVARIFERGASFQQSSRTVWGREALRVLDMAREVDFPDNFEGLFGMVWKEIVRVPDIDSGPVTEKMKITLSNVLEARFYTGVNNYLPVSLNKMKHSTLQLEDFISFQKMFPYIKFIWLTDDAESGLLVDDGDLYDLIHTFFFRVIEEHA